MVEVLDEEKLLYMARQPDKVVNLSTGVLRAAGFFYFWEKFQHIL